jgi:6-phosphogluconate dehydrogenase
MLPAGDVTEAHLTALADLLAPGDLLVDGANSYYKDSMRRAGLLAGRGLRFADVGVSGGVWGLVEGYSLMVGGEAQDVERLRPALETLAPAADLGWGHVGPHGAGHFVKMVHNGIEYGIMQALAEGFELMQARADFALDLDQVARIWQHGSVVRSWLLDLVERALAADPSLDKVVGAVTDSGEGRWTVLEGIEQGLSLPVITASLLRRLRSREEAPFGDRLLAVMREQFGGHEVRREQ